MATSVVNPRAQFFANNGRPLIGGRIHTYVAGSSTRATTYKDAAKAQPNTNPIVLDGRGEAQIYLAEGVEYKFVIEDSKGALIYTQEPVYGAVWPNAADWPSDATLAYKYMSEAKAAVDSMGVTRAPFDTYAQALNALPELQDGDRIEVSIDETQGGARTRYKVDGGSLVFVVNLDQLRQELEVEGGLKFDATKNYAVRTIGARLSESVSVKSFPWLASGDLSKDDTASIQAADDWCAERGLTLDFPRGVYKCTDGITKRAHWRGVGAPKIGVFPLVDDKQFLIPGHKHKIPGSTLLFTGAGSKSITTLRSDQFSEMRFAVLAKGRSPNPDGGIEDIGIVCDFNFRNEVGGNVTLPGNDAQADYDVGLLLENCDLAGVSNVTVGGYWKKAGTVHFGIDPDGATLINLRTMGDIGLAVIGDTTGTNSALNFHGGAIYSNDHHSRSVAVGEQWGKHAVYIDIPSNTGLGSRNGINFFGTLVATKVSVPVKYDRCGSINWYGVVFENADQAGSSLAGGPKKQIGTEYTGDIGFFGCRLNGEQIRGSGGLLSTTPNSTILIQGSNAGVGQEMWKGMHGIRMLGSASGQLNIQMTSDGGVVSTSGAIIRRTQDGAIRFLIENIEKFRLDNGGIALNQISRSTVILSGGEITVSRPFHLISGSGDLKTINGGADGMRVVLMRATSEDSITIKDQLGNIRIPGDFNLGSFDTIELIYTFGHWVEIGRSDRAPFS